MSNQTAHPSTAAPPNAAMLWLVLVVVGVAWGGTGPLSKLAVSTGHHPVGIVLWTAILGSAVLTAVLVATGRRLPLSWRHLGFYLGCGLLGNALPNGVSYAAYGQLPIGVVMIVLSLVPIMTLLIALPLRIEAADPRRLLGIGLGIVAVLLIALPRTSLPDAGKAIWILLPVVTAVSYAAENIFVAVARPRGTDPLILMCGLMWGSLFLLLPTAALTDAWFGLADFGVPEQSIVAIAVLNVCAYFGFLWLIGHAGPVFASQIGYVVTGSGVLLGMIFFDERHSAWIWAALLVMSAGLALVRPRTGGGQG